MSAAAGPRTRPSAQPRKGAATRHAKRVSWFTRELGEAAEKKGPTARVAVAADFVRAVMSDLPRERREALADAVVSYLFGAAEDAYAAEMRSR